MVDTVIRDDLIPIEPLVGHSRRSRSFVVPPFPDTIGVTLELIQASNDVGILGGDTLRFWTEDETPIYYEIIAWQERYLVARRVEEPV